MRNEFVSRSPSLFYNKQSIPQQRSIQTDAVSYSGRSHSSVKKTVKQLIDKGELAMFDLTVADIISNKPDQTVVVTSPQETVFNAIKKMSEEKVGALVVVDSEMKPIGVISERDYLNKVVLKGLSSKSSLVKDIMTNDVYTAKPTISAARCMSTMTKGRFRHIPVVDDDGALLGIISIGDLVKHVIDQQKMTIQHLQGYIQGTY